MHEILENALIDQFCKMKNGSEYIKDTQDTMNLTYGIEIPPRYLALQFLIGIDVLPLERSITLTGKQGAGKSVFGWFLSSFISGKGGYTGFVDAENKTTWDQVHGIYRGMGKPTADGNFWRVAPKTQEDMFSDLTTISSTMTSVCAKTHIKNPKTGKLDDNPSYGIPLLYYVDSLSCLSSEDSAIKSLEKGEHVPGYSGMKQAGNLTHYLKIFVPHFVNKWPAILLAINHDKDDNKEGGAPPSGFAKKEIYTPGGVHKDFMYSLWIQVSRANSIGKHGVGEKRQGFTLKTLKSCFSEQGRQIGLLMKTVRDSYIDKESQEERTTITVDFDWERALVDILAGGTVGWGSGESVVAASELNAILDITRESAAKCSSKTFGLKDVSPSEVGAAIIARCEEDPEFYSKLKKILWINTKKKYKKQDFKPPGTGTKLSAEEKNILMGKFREESDNKLGTATSDPEESMENIDQKPGIKPRRRK
jgi:hypothetical protein